MENKAKTVYGRLSKVKADLAKTKLTKSGMNKYGGFKYYELTDFLPSIVKLNNENGLADRITFDKEKHISTLEIINVDNPEEKITFEIPYVEAEMLSKGGAPSNVDAIQRLGATITYNRRYLYMTAYSIVENDIMDSGESQKESKKQESVDEGFKKQIIELLTEKVNDSKLRNDIILTTLKEYKVKNWKSLSFNNIEPNKFIDSIEKNIELEKEKQQAEQEVGI